jgi:hypothetical protein
MLNDNLLEVNLELFEDVSKSDINKCIKYNEGKEVAFIGDRGYYDVSTHLIKFIIPRYVNSHTRQIATEKNIQSIWFLNDNNEYEIKKEFLK